MTEAGNSKPIPKWSWDPPEPDPSESQGERPTSDEASTQHPSQATAVLTAPSVTAATPDPVGEAPPGRWAPLRGWPLLLVFAGLTLAWAYAPNQFQDVRGQLDVGAVPPAIAWTLAVLALVGAAAGALGFTTGMGIASGACLVQAGVFGLTVTTRILTANSPLATQAMIGPGLLCGVAATVVGLVCVAKARDQMMVTPSPPVPGLIGLGAGMGGLLFAAAWLVPVLGFLSFGSGGAQVLVVFWFWVSPILVALVVASVRSWRSGSDFWPSVALVPSIFMVLIALANILATVGAVLAVGAAVYGTVLTACRQYGLGTSSVRQLRSIGSKRLAAVVAVIVVVASGALLATSVGIAWLRLDGYSRSGEGFDFSGTNDGPFQSPSAVVPEDGTDLPWSGLTDDSELVELVDQCGYGLMDACDEGFQQTEGAGRVGEFFAGCGLAGFSIENGGTCEARFAAGQTG